MTTTSFSSFGKSINLKEVLSEALTVHHNLRSLHKNENEHLLNIELLSRMEHLQRKYIGLASQIRPGDDLILSNDLSIKIKKQISKKTEVYFALSIWLTEDNRVLYLPGTSSLNYNYPGENENIDLGDAFDTIFNFQLGKKELTKFTQAIPKVFTKDSLPYILTSSFLSSSKDKLITVEEFLIFLTANPKNPLFKGYPVKSLFQKLRELNQELARVYSLSSIPKLIWTGDSWMFYGFDSGLISINSDIELIEDNSSYTIWSWFDFGKMNSILEVLHREALVYRELDSVSKQLEQNFPGVCPLN